MHHAELVLEEYQLKEKLFGQTYVTASAMSEHLAGLQK